MVLKDGATNLGVPFRELRKNQVCDYRMAVDVFAVLLTQDVLRTEHVGVDVEQSQVVEKSCRSRRSNAGHGLCISRLGDNCGADCDLQAMTEYPRKLVAGNA